MTWVVEAAEEKLLLDLLIQGAHWLETDERAAALEPGRGSVAEHLLLGREQLAIAK